MTKNIHTKQIGVKLYQAGRLHKFGEHHLVCLPDADDAKTKFSNNEYPNDFEKICAGQRVKIIGIDFYVTNLSFH